MLIFFYSTACPAEPECGNVPETQSARDDLCNAATAAIVDASLDPKTAVQYVFSL